MSGQAPQDSASQVIPVRRDTGISIGAIAWSTESDKRFAVVNHKTVHEGDHVSGLEVAEIGKDGIIFRDGSETYKVLMKRR